MLIGNIKLMLVVSMYAYIHFYYSKSKTDINYMIGVLLFPGSPFQFTVGPITDGGSHKVKAIGPGLLRGEVNKPCMYIEHQSTFHISFK